MASKLNPKYPYQSGSTFWLPYSTTSVPEYRFKYKPSRTTARLYTASGSFFGKTKKINNYSDMAPTPKMLPSPAKTPAKRARSASKSPARKRGRTLFYSSRSRSRSVSRGASTSSYRPQPLVGTVSRFSKVKKTLFLKKNKSGQLTKTGIMQKGVLSTSEKSVTQVNAAAECQWVGHHNAPYEVVAKNVFRSMVKALINRAGRSLPSMDDVMVNQGHVTGEQFAMRYYASQTSTTLVNITYTIVAGETFRSAADGWFNLWSSTASSAGQVPLNWRYDRIEFIPSQAASKIPYVRINLAAAKFDMRISSVLKIQNRTSSDATGSTELVTAIPLHGKSYVVKGNTYLHVNTREQLAANITDGIISFSAASNTSMSEPPPPQVFVNCRSDGNVTIEPGSIKTSYLKDYYSWSVTKTLYCLTTNLSLGGAATQIKVYQPKMGSTRLFGIEKVIKDIASNEITLFYEHEFDIGVAMTYKNTNVTEPVVQQI